MTTTVYMEIDLPTNSTSKSYGTPAQEWARMLNVGFFIIDGHDHSEGSGKQITSSDLTFDYIDLNDFGMYGIDNITFSPVDDQEGISAGTLYTYGDDLYYRNGDSEDVRITESGSIVTSGVEGFNGDYTTDGSKVTFFGDDYSFIFYGANSTDIADVECSSIICSGTATVPSYTGSLTASGSIKTSSYGYIPYAVDGSLAVAYSDRTGEDTRSSIYPFIPYRDKNAGLSLTYSESGGSLAFRYGAIGSGYNSLGSTDSLKKRFELSFVYDVNSQVITSDGSLGSDWSVSGSYYTASFTITESTPYLDDTSGTYIFHRKPQFLIGDTNLYGDIAENYNFVIPEYYWDEVNYGSYKVITIKINSSSLNTTNSDYPSTTFSKTPYSFVIATLKGVFV